MARGFTLVEMLVTIGIIGLLAAIVIPNYRRGDESLRLDRAAQGVASEIRAALDRTLRAESYACTTPGPTDFGGYGLHFDTASPASYIVFADCNDNQKFENSGGNTTNPDEVLETISLDAGIRLKALTPNPKLNVVSVAPKPDIFIMPGDEPEGQIVLELESDSSRTKTITITKGGAMDID